MNSIEDVIDRLEELIEYSKPIPFTESIRVNRKEIEDLVYELKLSIPTALRDADDIVENCDNYISSAKTEAETIVSNAKMEASKLVSEHEVYIRAVDAAEQQAEATAQEINTAVTDAIINLDNMLADVSKKIESMNYVINEEFKNTVGTLNSYVDEVYEMRKDLRG